MEELNDCLYDSGSKFSSVVDEIVRQISDQMGGSFQDSFFLDIPDSVAKNIRFLEFLKEYCTAEDQFVAIMYGPNGLPESLGFLRGENCSKINLYIQFYRN